MKPLEAPEIREHVDRIAGSKIFAESERLRRFLRFTVESKLARQHERVKEYVLGREVFDRTEGYDPRLDPIVRVEARRLRSKLAEYYAGPGAAETVRLDYPKGSYLPVFVRSSDARTARSAPQKRVLLLAGVMLAALVIAAVAWRASAMRASTMVAVMPAQWIWADHAQSDPRAIPIAEAFTSELANRNLANVVAWPVVAHGATAGKPLSEIGTQLSASRLLTVMVRREDGQDLVTLFEIDPQTGRKVRALHYETPVISLTEQRALARRMADDFGASEENARQLGTR